MSPTELMRAIESVPGLQDVGVKLKGALHQAVLSGGEPARDVADILHGTWLGHPLHPPLTDLVVGGWSLGTVFDLIAAWRDDGVFEQVADRCIEAGIVAAIPTALTGLTDFSTVQKPAVASTTAHATLNNVGLVLYLWSVRERRRGNRRRGVGIALVAFAIILFSAWIGGHLAYSQKVGVDHGQSFDGPGDWTAVLDAGELEVGAAQRVNVNGQPILVYRSNGQVYAMDAVCGHAGGPLDEGSFEDGRVTCPWHDSVFDLCDGHVVHGPAMYPQRAFEARTHDGQVEVRLRRV